MRLSLDRLDCRPLGLVVGVSIASNHPYIVKKTLIFDLDETLVHCIDDIENNPCDQVIHVTFPNGETVQAGINIRPYAIECLKKANENY